MTAACFVGAALRPGKAGAAPLSALAVAAAGARPSRRDALGRAPAVVFALLFAISPSVQSRRTTRRHCNAPAIGWAQAGCEGSPAPPSGAGQGTRIAMLRNEPKSSPIWRRADVFTRHTETPFARNCLRGQQL